MIGIYDSGVGGLAVLREVRNALPDVDLLYLADQAHLPYGDRPLHEVRSLAEQAVQALLDRGATTVVIACNSASAAAIGHLRELHPDTPFVGMEPAVKPAAATTANGVIGVLATQATFQAASFDQLVGKYAEGTEVIAHPCPGWADAVEDGWPLDSAEPIRQHLQPLVSAGVDTLVLGCSHYSFLGAVIGDVVGPGVTIVDPVEAIARQTARVARTDHGSGRTTYLTTGDPGRLVGQVRRLIGEQVEAASVT